jgi:hypothetical protein
MKTNSITRKHFDKLVNVIVKEFPATKVTQDTATRYNAWNFDLLVRACVSLLIHPDGEINLMVGIPGNNDYVWITTLKEFRRVKKQLIAACRKYR